MSLLCISFAHQWHPVNHCLISFLAVLLKPVCPEWRHRPCRQRNIPAPDRRSYWRTAIPQSMACRVAPAPSDRRGRVAIQPDPIGPHRPRDVFELLLAEVFDGEVEFAYASSCTRAETQIPPGSAIPSRRAATLTPSPKMSPSSTTTSSTLIPIRNSIRSLPGIAAQRSAIAVCTSVAHCNASTTLANSTRRPSPLS